MATRTRALLTALAIAALGVAALRIGPAAPSSPVARPGRLGDVAMFEAAAARMRTGEGYYDALGEEMRSRNYPTAQIFNWRTPLLLSVLAAAPRLARGVLVAAGVALCFLTIAMLRPLSVAVSAGVMQVGTVALIAIPTAAYMGEVWAGTLVGLSLCAYLRPLARVGAALGLAALFIRELAAPYCVVCMVACIRARRWPELRVWTAGGGLYAAYFGWHVMAVLDHRLPTDAAHHESWLQFGGLPFVLEMIGTHSWLLLLPGAAAIVALMVLLVSIAGRATPLHVRLACGAYVVLFAMLGQTFNTYWGFIAWPTWSIGVGYGVVEIKNLVRSLTRRSPLVSASPVDVQRT